MIGGELTIRDLRQRIKELERYNVGLANESCAQQEQITELKNALARQAKAAISGMDAAKAAASSNLEHAKRLHAESSPEALESERAANAVLTELVAKLEHERDAYRTAEEHQIALRQKIEQERDALAADRADLIQELIPLQNMTHGLARSGGCSPDYPNDAKAVLERVTGGHAPFFDDSGPSAKCLSRRDALKQAEWISSYLRSLPFNTTRISPIDLNIEAKKLLREAEAQK